MKERIGKLVNKILRLMVGEPVHIPAPQPRETNGRFAKK
jgi:hypothetical protein